MSSEFGADIFDVNGAIRFKRIGSPAPIDIPANGVLVVAINEGATITIGGGGATSLVGIKYVDEDGVQITIDDDRADVKFFRSAPGVTITVMHDQAVDLDAVALPTSERLLTSSAKNFTMETINAQAFFAYSAAAAGFRWFFVDRLNYTPSTPVDWDGSPASVPEALDRIASSVALLLSGPIP